MKQKHLKFIPRIVESRWLTRNFCIHAMMDLSDGLGADLPRLARASKVGFNIDVENLPVAHGANVSAAISEGEDYELLFAISPRDGIHLARAWRRKFPKLSLTRIGSLSRKSKSEKREIASWLHSFPAALLRRKRSDADLRRTSTPVLYSLSKASLAAARPSLQRVSSPDWEAAHGNQSHIYDRARISRRTVAHLSLRFLSPGKSRISRAAWS